MKPNKYFIMNSGTKIYPDNISENDINLEDIAHHLTNIQRFGGALPFKIKYSVASHSINLCEYALARYGDLSLGAACLLHDASEAYLGDIVSPLKVFLPEYKDIEWDLMNTIQTKYNIDYRYDSIVSHFDKLIVIDEVRNLLPNRSKDFGNIEGLGIEILSDRKPQFIKQHFLNLCEELNITDVRSNSNVSNL